MKGVIGKAIEFHHAKDKADIWTAGGSNFCITLKKDKIDFMHRG